MICGYPDSEGRECTLVVNHDGDHDGSPDEPNPKDDPDYDPTPWCTGCGAMRASRCHCGPIADNN